MELAGKRIELYAAGVSHFDYGVTDFYGGVSNEAIGIGGAD